MTKLTKEQINEIRNSKENPKELVKNYGVCYSNIIYHKNPETRKKALERQRRYRSKLTKEQIHNINVNRRDYIRNYMKRRYDTDEVFRKKAIQRAIKYKKKR